MHLKLMRAEADKDLASIVLVISWLLLPKQINAKKRLGLGYCDVKEPHVDRCMMSPQSMRREPSCM